MVGNAMLELAAWIIQIIAVMATVVLGIFGILNDYRNSDKTLSNKGQISISLIVLLGAVGIVLNVIQGLQEEQKQTKILKEIQRTLNPIEGLEVWSRSRVPLASLESSWTTRLESESPGWLRRLDEKWEAAGPSDISGITLSGPLPHHSDEIRERIRLRFGSDRGLTIRPGTPLFPRDADEKVALFSLQMVSLFLEFYDEDPKGMIGDKSADEMREVAAMLLLVSSNQTSVHYHQNVPTLYIQRNSRISGFGNQTRRVRSLNDLYGKYVVARFFLGATTFNEAMDESVARAAKDYTLDGIELRPKDGRLEIVEKDDWEELEDKDGNKCWVFQIPKDGEYFDDSW